MFRPIKKIEGSSEPISMNIEDWINTYKETFVQHPHDQSQLTLILPDDCLLVAGPTRLRQAASADSVEFFPIGFANTVNYSETRQVQPLKAIGSRRHIFAATNQPVQISIARMLILGMNTLRTMYARADFGSDISDRNSSFSHNSGTLEASWFSNMEEDIFRVPIGLGIIYNAPASLGGGMAQCAGAEYFEVCTLVNKNITLQSGQAMVMEQVTMMADRVIPWCDVSPEGSISNDYYAQRAQVHEVSDME